MAPAGDVTEPIAAAEIKAEIIDEKRRASVIADPRASSIARQDRAVNNDDEPSAVPTGLEAPTMEEMATLRRVPNHIPAKLFTIAFIELCERFSYYGCTVVCKLRNSFHSPLIGNRPVDLLDADTHDYSHQLRPAASP